MYSALSLLFVLQLVLPAWSSVSLVPPSTFPDASSTSSTSSGSSATSSSSNSNSRSSSSSTAASSTSIAFPPLSTYTPCVTNCLAIAIARVNCSSIVDVNCFCAKPTFPAELVGCIESACPDQLATSEDLAQRFCNLATSSTSLSFTPTAPPSSSSSSSSSTTTSNAPSTSSPSNSSGAEPLLVTHGNLLGFAMTIFGLLMGALVL